MLRLNERMIKKIAEATPDVKLINGNFMRATIKFPHSKKGIQLAVEVSHPSLEWASGLRNEVTIVAYDSPAMSHGVSYSLSGALENKTLPDPMLKKIEEMRKLATITDEMAAMLNKDLSSSLDEVFENLGVRA